MPTVKKSNRSRPPKPPGLRPSHYVAGVVIFIGAFWAGDFVGTWRTKSATPVESVTQTDPSSQSFSELPLENLNQVLGLLRVGQVEEAQEILGELGTSHAWVRGLSFLRALGFLQGGELEQANESIAQGLGRGERVSDSLALQAAIESARAVDPDTTRMVDPRQRAKGLLEEAIVVDPLNPAPFLELAAHYRFEKNSDLARAYLQAARDRLNPVGEAAVIAVTLALMDAEAGDGELVLAGLPQPGAAHAFLSARQAAQRGDGAEVERQLRLARTLVGLEAFVYLMGDPALRGIEYPEALARP